MDLERARFLASSEGRRALASLDPALASLTSPALATSLRRQFAPAEASALAEQLTLAARARERFGEDPGFLYATDGLEMMTHPRVARRRAARLASLGLPVADLTCGLGGDLRAIIDAGARSIGLERTPATALLARANVPGAGIVRADAETPPLDLSRFAVMLDPSRRGGAGRTFDPDAFSPNWNTAIELASRAPAAVMKAPPGLDRRIIPAEAEVELVQLGRVLREAALWFGRGTVPGLHRAVLLPRGSELTSLEPECPGDPLPLGAVLFDPESCVTRAALVRHLGQRLGARLVDRQLAYLTADEPAFDPFAATFVVLEVIPFSVARLKTRLRERRWRPDEIRRRAFPIEPDELRRLLGKIDGDAVTLLLTTIAGKRLVIVARRLQPGTDEGCRQ